MEQVIHTVLEAGLEKPVKLLQITDVHLVNTDPSDPPEQQEHLAARKTVFEKEANFPPHTQSEYFEEAFRIAEEEGAFPIVTGDVMDVYCKGTRDEFHRISDGKDFMFTPGSHDFAQFCHAPQADYPEYYARIRPEVEAQFPNLKFTFDSRVIGGVNVITMDNSQDIFPVQACEQLKKEAEKGLPMVLFMHDPLSDHGLIRVQPRSEYLKVSEAELNASDEIIEFIGKCPLVLATFAGHWHCDQEHIAPCGARVFITPGLFKGICRLIEIR